MSVKHITGNKEFIKDLKNKKATFLLANSVTKTCEIEGITQAGIPGLIHLTPTLDSEFVATGKVYSMPKVAETPKGVPTPALITRAIEQLRPFNSLEFLDLGFEKLPNIEKRKLHKFGIKPSDRIDLGAKIYAKKVFEKGLEFGRCYRTDSDYIIVGETTPSGTTTAEATAKALGYMTEGLFSSSFKNAPTDIKTTTIERAVDLIKDEKDTFLKLGSVGDNMLIFVAGFIIEASKKRKVILAGGTQMAACLLVVNSLNRELGFVFNSANIGLFTTKWVFEDKRSEIRRILEQLDFNIAAFYSDFSFASSKIPPLKLYDKGEAKEGVGAGGALCYGFLQGLKEEDIVKEVEKFF